MIDYDALDAVEESYCDTFSFFDELGTKYIGGEGDNPRVFIVGEAPGAQEEVRGRPFVGPSGATLRDLMGIARLYATDWWAENVKDVAGANCWLTNVIKFRPAGNRTPTDLMIDHARPLLEMEWRAVGAPNVIVAVGGVALKAVLRKRLSILAVSGKPRECTARREVGDCGLQQVWVWPMVHPSFGLRNEAARPLIEKDWEILGVWLRDLDSRMVSD